MPNGFYHPAAFINSASVEFSMVPNANAGEMRVGLVTDANKATVNFADFSYCWKYDGTNLSIFEPSFSGNSAAYTPAQVAAMVLKVVYDGAKIVYYRDTTIVRSITVSPNLSLFAKALISGKDWATSNLKFAPASENTWSSISATPNAPDDNADVTGANTALAIVGQGPGATATGSAVLNEYIPAGDANRVRYSQFEGGLQGWGVINNPSAQPITQSIMTTNGRRAIRSVITFASSFLTVELGTTGLTNVGTRIKVTPNERLSVQSKLTVGAGNPAHLWSLMLIWQDAAGAILFNTTISSGTGDVPTQTLQSAFVTVPSNAHYVYLDLVIQTLSGGGGTYTSEITEPMIVGALAGQTVHPQFVPGPSSEFGADVTSIVDGPSTSVFAYDHTGATPEAGQFTRSLQYKLMTGLGYVSSGITWTYLVKTGTVNGFTNASGVQSMSGAGVGTFDVTSLGSSTATVEIKAVYNSLERTMLVTLSKTLAAPPSGGGGGPTTIASKSSGFANISSTTWVDITGTMNGTLPTGITAAALAFSLSAHPGSGSPNGSWGCEAKFQRFISSVWTDVGDVATGGSDRQNLTDPPELLITEASLGETHADSGMSAGSAQQWRVLARVASGGTRTHTITGTVTVTA